MYCTTKQLKTFRSMYLRRVLFCETPDWDCCTTVGPTLARVSVQEWVLQYTCQYIKLGNYRLLCAVNVTDCPLHSSSLNGLIPSTKRFLSLQVKKERLKRPVIYRGYISRGVVHNCLYYYYYIMVCIACQMHISQTSLTYTKVSPKTGEKRQWLIDNILAIVCVVARNACRSRVSQNVTQTLHFTCASHLAILQITD